MKIELIIIISFSFLSSLSQSLAALFPPKKETFSFSDSSFKIGQKRTLQVLYVIGQPELHPEFIGTVDSIARLMLKYEKINLEIGVHADSRGKAKMMSMHLTQARAQCIVDSIIARGVSKTRLKARGYEGVWPIISDEEISKAKTQEEKDMLHAKNRRTVATISMPGSGRKEFNLLETNFNFGDNLTTRKITFDRCSYTDSSQIMIDSIVFFMNRNKNIIIAVEVHASKNDLRYCPELPSTRRARSLVDSLIKKGIASERVFPAGLGQTQPIISEATIKQAKTKEEKEMLERYNSRITLRVIGFKFDW